MNTKRTTRFNTVKETILYPVKKYDELFRKFENIV